MEAGEHLADVVPGDVVVVFPAVVPQLPGVVHLLVVVVQVDAGVHAALHHLVGRGVVLVPAAGEDENAAGHEPLFLKIPLGDGGADVVGVDLLEALVLQPQAQVPQEPLVAVDVVAVEVVGAGHAPHVPPVDVLQGEGARHRGLAVPLDGEDGPLYRVVLGFQVPHLLVDLLVFLAQQFLDEGHVLLLQGVPDLGEAHAQLLHVDDHVQPGVLVDVVIAVAGLGVGVPGLQQALLVVQPQGGDGNPVEGRHLPDGEQFFLHRHPS